MHVAVGSENPVKVAAVEETLPEAQVIPTSVDSGVSVQPRSVDETIEGASTRAHRALARTPADYGCGLEGGVAYIEELESTALIMWATVTDGDVSHSGSGPTLPLPKAAVEGVESGRHLGAIIDDMAEMNGFARKDGAIGLFTNGLTNRRQALGETVACAVGPFLTEYYGRES